MAVTLCDTGAFSTQPPYDSYVDIDSPLHSGTNNGEVFDAMDMAL